MSILKIAIKNPCHQNYEMMEKGNTGRFCEQCSKEVIDFTSIGTAEIIDYFQHAKEKTCGRLTPLQIAQLNQPQNIQHTWKHKFAVFIATSLSFFTAQQAIAADSGKTKPNFFQTYSPASERRSVSSKIDTTTIKISGVVREKGTGFPLPGVSLIIKGSRFGAVTDTDGKFNFTFHSTNPAQLVLRISYIGFVTQEQKVLRGKPQEIILAPDESAMMGEVVVVRKHKNLHTRFLRKVKSWFR